MIQMVMIQSFAKLFQGGEGGAWIPEIRELGEEPVVMTVSMRIEALSERVAIPFFVPSSLAIEVRA